MYQWSSIFGRNGVAHAKMIGPHLEEISDEMAGSVKVAKLNIDENPDLAAQYGVPLDPDFGDVQRRRTCFNASRRQTKKRIA